MRASRHLTSGSEMLRGEWSVVVVFLKFFTAKDAKTTKDKFVCKFDILKIISILSLVQGPNDINHKYRTDISENNSE